MSAAISTDAVPSLSALLRSETRGEHEGVDEAFGRFDLTCREDYGAFLTAHARVVPALEAQLAPDELMPGWTGRSEALARDLHALGLPQPEVCEPDLPEGELARWGALYVLEGSRLGGAFLARRVPAGWPSDYLGAAHPQGQWRSLLDAIDEVATSDVQDAEAVRSARAVFAAFRQAALDG